MALFPLKPRRLLRSGLLSDGFTSSLSTFAPYRGCAHACAYCDGRAERYFVEGDFGSDIQYRENLPELLSAELPRLRETDAQGRKPLLCMGSGVTDCYQPAEAALCLARRAAELLLEAGQPCLLMTKSSLVMRDFDLWTELNRSSGFVLVMSVTGTDEAVREAFEPGASPLRERLATLKAFHDAGCPTGILAMPLLPWISDGDGALRDLFAAAAEAGVDFLLPGSLTLRPGRQKEHFMSVLARERPDLVERYRGLYGEERPSGAPLAGYSRAFAARAGAAAAGEGLPPFLTHARLRKIVPAYEALHLLFSQMESLYSRLGADTARLSAAASRFGMWLRERRIEFHRRRSLPGDWIDGRFRELVASEGWESLLGNAKLAAFARGIVSGGDEFDYGSLKAVPGGAPAAGEGFRARRPRQGELF